jgi:integrase
VEHDVPSISKRKNADGSTSYVAQVRIRPYRPTSKAFADRKSALAWAQEREKTLTGERERGGVRADLTTLTFAQLAREYLKDPGTKALASQTAYQRQLDWWIEHHGNVRALEFGPLVVRNARDELLKGRSVGTVNRYLAVARIVVNFGRTAALLPSNSAWPPGLMLTEPRGRERFLTDAELARVLGQAKAFSPLMFGAVMFAIGVGCRQSEQLRVKWGDIDAEHGTVMIRPTKVRNTDRRAHIPPAVIEALKGLHGENVVPLPTRHVFAHDDGTALENYELIDRWQKVRKAAKVEDVRWHDLRHASASFLIQNGASLAEVAHQLGHLNVATSKRYAHLVPGAKPTGADKLNEKLRGS